MGNYSFFFSVTHSSHFFSSNIRQLVETENFIVISSVQSLSHVWLFVTPWTAARQASLSITNSWSLFKLMPIESVMPSNHLILCHPLLLPPSVFPSIRVFSNESALHIRWSFSLVLFQIKKKCFWDSPLSRTFSIVFILFTLFSISFIRQRKLSIL